MVIVIYLGTNTDYMNVKKMKKKADLLDGIDINPSILAGKPVIKGTRIPVYLILELLSAGYDFKKIINSYPSLKERDIRAAIEYAALTIKNEELVGYC
jgi:uncharacterized protein (DUF433 family)